MTHAQTAAELFTARNSCSQAVFAAFAPELGVDRTLALRLSSGLGGGLRIGSTCGAALGALLVLGLQNCDEECSPESKSATMQAVTTFFEHFEERLGSTDCPGIMGCDYRTPEGKAQSDAEGLREARCLPAVLAAVEILEAMQASTE